MPVVSPLWFVTKDQGKVEEVYQVIRQIGEKASYHQRSCEKLLPRNGAIAVGSAHTEHFIKGEILSEYLRGLRTGKTPQQAYESAREYGEDCVAKWNARVEWQRHLWKEFGRVDLDVWHRLINSIRV